YSFAPCDTLRLQHSLNNEIDILVVKPFGFAKDALLNEAQPLRNAAAFQVTRSAVQNDAIAPLVRESVVRQSGGRPRDNTVSLIRNIQPVADLRSSIQAI